MDHWTLAIEKNTKALTQIVAGLFVLCGLSAKPSSEHEIHLTLVQRRILMRILRTTEAALRRLIVLYVNVHGITAKSPKPNNRPLPDFASFGSGTHKRTPVFRLFDPRKPLCFISTSQHEAERDDNANYTIKGVPRVHCFDGLGLSPSQASNLTCLFAATNSTSSVDLSITSCSGLTRASMHGPKETLTPHAVGQRDCLGVDSRIKSDYDDGEWTEDNRYKNSDWNSLPPTAEQALRVSAAQFVSVRSLDSEQETNSAEDKQTKQESNSSQKLICRLQALNHALKNLPKQARRLARIMAAREDAPAGVNCIPPIRPGIPPGYAKHSKTPEHETLRECHGILRDWESGFL